MVKAERNTRPTQRVAGLAKTPLFLLRFSLFPIFVMAVKPLFFYPKRVNVLGQRLVSFQIFLVSLWILVFGETASKIPGESGEWCVVPHTRQGCARAAGLFLFLPCYLTAVVCMQPSCGGLAARAARVHAPSPTIASRACRLCGFALEWVNWGRA